MRDGSRNAPMLSNTPVYLSGMKMKLEQVVVSAVVPLVTPVHEVGSYPGQVSGEPYQVPALYVNVGVAVNLCALKPKTTDAVNGTSYPMAPLNGDGIRSYG